MGKEKSAFILAISIMMIMIFASTAYAFSIGDFFNKVTGRAATINQTCSDSDGGLNYDAQGSVSICRGNQCKIYKDSCSGTSGNIAERYCKSNNVATKVYKCSGVCKNGMCVAGESINCSPGQLIGDADADGQLTSKDSNIIFSIYMGNISKPQNICCVDVDKNLRITPNDALQVQNMVSNQTTQQEKCTVTSAKKQCRDSDGYNIYKKGEVTIINDIYPNGYTFTDACHSDKTVSDVVCVSSNSDQTNVKTANCPKGYACKDGACLQQATNTTTGSLYVMSRPSRASIYIDNVYKGVTPRTFTSFQVGEYKVSVVQSGYETFYTTAKVSAGATTGVSANLTKQATNTTTCTDSDRGKNYYVKGITKGPNNPNAVDFCINYADLGVLEYPVLKENGGSDGVIEHYCDTYNNVANEGFKCPNGCQDGACFRQNVTTPVNATGSMKITVIDKYVVCANNEVCGVLYNANVSVYDSRNKVVGFDDTSDGVAAFYDLKVGTYIASASATGYYAAKSSFKIVAGSGKYLTMGLEKIRSCTDSDFGKTIFKYGETKDNRGKSYKDNCSTTAIVSESYCIGGYAYQAKLKCPTGYKCSGGVCIQ